MSRGREGGDPAAAGDVADHLRLLVESQPDYAIFLLDPSGHVLTWNGGARRLKGYAADEIIGRHFSVFYPPEQVAEGVPERILEAARLTGRHEAEGWRVRKDGTRFWADVVITALRDERGDLVGLREGDARSDEPSARDRAAPLGGRRASRRQRRARAVPPAGHERARLRDLPPRRVRAHPDVEPGRREHQGLHGRRGHRPALRAVLHGAGPRSQSPRLRAGGRDPRGPLRGGGLARPQGRHAVLGQRRHHRAARRARRLSSASPRSHAT